jgi:transketolase
MEDLMGLRKIGAQLQGHPDMHRTPGVEVSTGSLGQGLSMSVGICLALRLDGLDETAQVFTLMSDGDIQEGQSWEGAAAAAHYEIPNLTAIVDYNHLQTDGTTEEVMDTGDVRAKFEAFGWDSIEIDGHDMGAITEALERSRTLRRPSAIVCQTKKGRGVSFMEGRFGFHGKPPSQDQASEAMDELESRLREQTAALESDSAGGDSDA